MEVDLELVTKLDSANKELKQLKDNMVGIDKATASVGKTMSNSFKTPTKDIEALGNTLKTLTGSMKGFEALVNDLAHSDGPEELVANFQKLVITAEQTLDPIESIEFKLKAIAALRPFLNDAQDLDNVDKEVKQLNKDLDLLRNKDVGKPIESLRSKLVKAKAEVVQLAEAYGPLDARTLKAAKSAGELADQVGDINATINALNPDAKLQAFTDLGQGIAGSFAIATGAMGLFGVASEDVQEGLLKIQSAIQLTQGINQILQLKDAWTNVRAVVKIFIADSIASTTATEAQTAAEVENTIAKEANAVVTGEVATAEAGAIVATEGLAVAQSGAAVSAGVLTTALAILTGPLGIILATVGALVLVYKLVGEEVESYNRLTAEQISKSNELAAAQRDLKNAINDTKDSIRIVNGTLSDTQAELLSRQRKFFSDLDALDEELNLGIIQAQEKANSGLINDAEAFETALKQLKIDSNAKRVAINEKYQVDVDLINAKANAKEKEDEKKIRDDQVNKLKQNLDKLIQLRKDYAAALENLAKQTNSALADLFGGTTRIELEKEASLKEIDELKKSLREKGQAEVDQAKKIYGETSVKYKRILDEFHEGIIISDNQFNILRRQVEKKAQEDLLQLTLNSELARTETILDQQTKLLKQFEINSKKKAIELRSAGASQSDIDALHDKELLDLNNQFIKDDLDQQQAYFESRIDNQEEAGKREIDVLKDKQLQMLNLGIQFDEIRLQNLKEARESALTIDPDLDTTAIDTEINDLTSKIRKGRSDLKKLQDEQEPFSFAKLLGLKLTADDEAEFNAQAESFLQSATEIYSTINQMRLDEVRVQLDANRQITDSLNQRIDETESALDREIKLHEEGFASNVELTRKQLEEQKKQRDKALAERQKLLADERKLARQQAQIAAVQQVASLGVAAAKLFEKGAITGPVGILTAIATIAGMLAAFLSFKASLSSAATTQTLGGGGRIKGNSHLNGGVDVNAEGDEFMIRKQTATKHPRAMEAINEEDWKSVPDSFILPILRARGITLSKDSAERISRQDSQIKTHESNQPIRLDKLEKSHQEMTKEVKDINRKLSEETRETNSNGDLVIIKGKKTIIVKR